MRPFYQAQTCGVRPRIFRNRNYEGDSQAAAAIGNLGRLYSELHNTVNAEAMLKRSLALTRQHNGEHGSSYAWSLTYLARFYTSVARFNEAETTFRQAVNVFDEGKPKRNWGKHVALSGLGATLLGLGKYDEANRAGRRWLSQVLPAMAPTEQLLYLFREEKLPLFGSL